MIEPWAQLSCHVNEIGSLVVSVIIIYTNCRDMNSLPGLTKCQVAKSYYENKANSEFGNRDPIKSFHIFAHRPAEEAVIKLKLS